MYSLVLLRKRGQRNLYGDFKCQLRNNCGKFTVSQC